jgi:histidine triad (HIT) family protein
VHSLNPSAPRPTYASVIDTVAEHFRRAYLESPDDKGALLHARAVAGSAIADLVAEQQRHRTATMLMEIRPDVPGPVLDQAAAELKATTAAVRRTLEAVLAHQVCHNIGTWQVWERDLEGCPFCDIARGRAEADIVHQWPDAIAFVPLNPVTPGHVLVAPRAHAFEFTHEPDITAAVARRAAELAVVLDPVAEYNVITSAGTAATQTVDHLHLHLIPRREGDGLALPWAPAPVEATATKCAACGMRLGYVNHRGTVLGWGCAGEGDENDHTIAAPQLARALITIADHCVASGNEAPLEAMVEAIATDPRIVPDAAAALADIAVALAPVIVPLLRRTHPKDTP